MSIKQLIFRLSPFLIIILAVGIFFWRVFIFKEIPVPGDFIVGTYYPWLDYKWGGFVTGVPVKNPVTSDVVSVIYPIRELALNLIKNGEFPLWNSRMFAGYPLLANLQAAILSPTFIFYFLFSFPYAWTLQVICQPLLSAFFTYLFLRHLKLGKIPSILGGIIYAFSGFSMMWMEWNAHALVVAWLPLFLLLFDKTLKEGKRITGVALSIVFCFQFFSGYPQVILYEAVAAALWLVFNIREIKVKYVFYSLFFVFLGLGLSAIQLLPAWELMRESQRVKEILSPDLINLPWINLITFLAPDYFGNPATANYWGVGNYTINTGYTGVVTLIMATLAIIRFKVNRSIRYFVALLLIALVLALPTPVAKLVSGIPFFGAASNTRSLFLANFSLAALAAIGGDFLIKNKGKIASFYYVIPLILLLILTLFTYTNLKYSFVSFNLKDNMQVAIRNLFYPLIFTAIATIIIFLKSRFFKIKNINYFAIIGLGILVAFELFRYGWKYTPFSKVDYLYPDTPVLTYLKNIKKPSRFLPGDVISMNMWVPYGLESPAGYDAVYPARWAKYVAVSNSGKVDAASQGRYGTLEIFSNRFTDLANGQYLTLLNDKDIRKKYSKPIPFNLLTEVLKDKSVTVYKKESALPRAIFVTEWETLKGDKEILTRLIDASFPYKNRIILESDLEGIVQSKNNQADITFDIVKNNYSKLKVNNVNDGLLFVSEMYYPGWKVRVDNQEGKILQADYVFRAVPLKAGRHTIEFIYEPKSFRIGKWVTAFSLLSIVLIIIYEYITYRRLRLT